MENIEGFVGPGVEGETLSDELGNLPDSLESFLDEQKEKPNELKMIDSDILALASQVGDDLDDSNVDEAKLASDLSFLDNAETKEATIGEDDLSFLVGDGKMEVDNEDLAFLEEQGLSETESYSDNEEESDLNEEESDEEEDDEENETSDEEEEEEEEESEGSGKKDQDVDDEGVFGQVSFYDDESSNSMEVQKQKEKKLKKKVKPKKLKNKSKSKEDADTKSTKKRRKRKRRRSDDDVPKSGASLKRRKNIRSIMSEKDLDKEMLSAQNEELERQKRLMELKKSLLRENAAAGVAAAKAAASASTSIPIPAATTSSTTSMSTGTSPPKEKDSQLKSLLQVAEEEAEKEAESKAKKQLDKEVVKVKRESVATSPPSDVITLSSDSDDSDDLDDDDSDEVVMVPSDEDIEDGDNPEDVNNGGSHINDNCNLPDPDGRVKVNIGHPADDPDIYLAPQIAQAIKPHQIGGVRFLYDNLVESLERFRTTPGFGCILAHSMGLGKTIQLISFIDIFVRCTGGKRVLCIVPINTLQNWLAEFNYWLPPPEKLHPDDNLTQSRIFPIYIINDSMKTMTARAGVIQKWQDNGGVLLMGYEMFRLLSSKKVVPSKAKSRSKKAASHPEVIDVEEEDKNKSLMIDMHSMLVDPGPDLVMCDEGHRIKNSSAAISQALKNIKTRRRVVLTGYPLQNNLMEYWCMVDFVRPNFLGTKTEFSNMFERPIMNGQCMDSTASDKKIMRHRSYVLHNLLEGFVQRRGHTVLQLSLPPKMEHVFLVRLSPVQRKIYCEFMNAISESGLCSWANNNPLKAFAVCCKIWNHPDILHDVLTQHIADKDNDLDIDTGEGGASKKKKNLPKSVSSMSLASTDSATSTLTPSASNASLASMASEGGSDKNPITYDWAEPLMKDYVAGLVENSGKFMLMNSIVEECLAVGDKVLIFSQSLLTLNKIEEFMGKLKVPRMEVNENWQRNRTYFRLDGSTSAQDREKLINQFNDQEGSAWVFLLSTKAGCLGINLVAANRVIVIDASWNPCHDCQAICRVYRFGQMKNSYVYRLITDNTLEKRIYDRQINKQGMSDRIVDDMNPENKLTRRQVENLLDFEDQDFPLLDFSNAASKCGNDTVMQKVLERHGQWLTKTPFTHESLLIDRKELRLSKREKRLAKEGYARDKRMNITYTRPSYAAYYPQTVGGLPNRLPLNSRYNYAAFRRGPIVRPIASVRPIIAANSQNGGEKIKQFGGQPLRPGVTIHQVITTTEIVLPGTNTGTTAGASTNKIGAGQKILVIKTPKGVYIRTNDGKMFAVRSKTGAGLADVNGTAAGTTTTTTTLTSASGNQVFITPGNLNMSTGTGGKKPPIIIVSNKKGAPITMARGGSIIRTLPYGSSNLLSSLKPSILRAGTTKDTDSTTTTTSTSTKASTDASSSSDMTEKFTSLADLIGDDDEGKRDGEKGEGATPAPKMPVIVLPSLGVRTANPPSSIQSSTVATTSPGGGTVVIMPTKPVVSMGTRKVSKNPRTRKSKAKNSNTGSVGVGTNLSPIAPKKKGISLLMTSSNTASISSTTTSHTSMGTGTSDISMESSTNGNQQNPSFDAIQMNNSSTDNTQQQKQQMSSSSFPDVNSMWQNNFGPPPQMGMTKSLSTSTPSSMGTGMNEGFTGSMMINQGPITAGQSNDTDNNGPNSNPNIMGGNTQPQNHSSGFSNQHSQGYNSMNNPYMSGNMGPYGMGSQPMLGQGMGHMQNQMTPYGSGIHPGFMPPPSGPFSQSLPPPPGSMPNQTQQGNMMYGTTPNPAPGPQFGSSFRPSNQQNPPPFGNTGFQGPNNPPSFGFNSSMGNMNYGNTTTSSSFMSQPQGDQGFSQTQTSMAPTFHQSQNTNPMFAMDSTSNNSLASQNQSQQQQLPMASSSSSPHTSTTPTQPDPGLLRMDRGSRDNSPFSLTLLGSDSNTAGNSSSKPASNQRTKSTSKKSKNSSASSRTNSPSVNKLQSNNKQQGGNNIPSPAPSPRHAISSPAPSPRHATPDTPKSFMDISNNGRSGSTQNSSSTNNPQGFGSSSNPSLDGLNSTTSFGSFDPNSSNTGTNSIGGFGLDATSLTNSLSSGLSGHPPLGSDIGMGGSAFRAHQSSSSNLPAAPQPFRLDGAGGISGMSNSGNTPGLNYSSGMSAFSSPSGLAAGTPGYGNSAAFGNYGPSYGGSSSLPFSTSAMMPPPPQSMIGYPQSHLGYPSMSPLMMGAPAPTAAPPMGGSMWPMMPTSMMGGGYGYPTHPTNMGFSTPGLGDGQGFGHLGPGPGNN